MDEECAAPTRGSDRWSRAATLAAVLLATVWPRLAGLRIVFASGELMQWDGDSAYHLKRILGAMARFPDLLRFDPEMNWPAGAPCPWPDGFDLLAAAWGLLAGKGDPELARIAVLLFTPMIALVVAWAAMDLARLVIPEGPGKEGAVAAAGVLTSIAPSTLYQSSVGFLDHHIAELLVALLLAGWALRRLRGRPGSPACTPVVWELGGVLAVVLALWVFSGGVLYVALAVAIVLVAVLIDERPRLIGSGAPALAAAAALSALLAVPSVGTHGRVLSYQFPSLLQPLLVAVAAGALSLAVIAARVTTRVTVRFTLFALAGAVLALAGALALPDAWREIRAGLEGWLLRRDPWIATIGEFQPLMAGEEGKLMALWRQFGAIGVAAPLVLAVGGWVVVRSAGARGIAFLALSAGFVLFAVNQIRFARIGVPLLMIHTAAVLAAIAHRRRAHPRVWAMRAFPAVAALVLVVCDPILRPPMAPKSLAVPPIAEAALDLRAYAATEPRAGVLAQWDLGHFINVLSGIPTATNGFGPYLDAAGFAEAEGIHRTDGATLDAFLERRRLRFVVAGAMLIPMLTAVDGRTPFIRASDAQGAILDLDYMKAYALSPLVIGGSAIPGAGVRHIEHLMPVFATHVQPPALAFGLPAFWAYERVRGARLTGTALRGARVLATLDFREQGRPHVWRAFADAGPDGRFELVVPFPTRLVRPTISSGAVYALRIGDGPAIEVEVPEKSVRFGETIRVGALAAPPPRSPAVRAETAKERRYPWSG